MSYCLLVTTLICTWVMIIYTLELFCGGVCLLFVCIFLLFFFTHLCMNSRRFPPPPRLLPFVWLCIFHFFCCFVVTFLVSFYLFFLCFLCMFMLVYYCILSLLIICCHLNCIVYLLIFSVIFFVLQHRSYWMTLSPLLQSSPLFS